MLSLPPAVRIWLSAKPADLRKSFDTLAALVREGLGGDPLSGDIFVFRNKAADRIKLLVWEEDGYVIWYKRLEVGTFRFPPSPDAQPRVEIRAADLVMLLAGVDLSSVKRGKRYHRPVNRPPLQQHVGG
jgi:transposase